MANTLFWMKTSRRIVPVISSLYNGQLLQFPKFAAHRVISGYQTSTHAPSLPINVKSLPNHLQEYANDSVESILSPVNNTIFSIFDVVDILKALRVQKLLNNDELTAVTKDRRFHLLCKKFETSCHSLDPPKLVSALRSLLDIGIPPSYKLIDSTELIILSKIDDFTMIELVGCLHLHKKYMCTDRQKQVVEALVSAIQERISEIHSTAEVMMLIELFSLFNKTYLQKLENKLIEIFAEMDTKDLIKVIYTLAENAKRNKVLLNSAGFRLRQKKERPSLKETVRILYALNTLNYQNPHLLSYLTENCENEIDATPQPSVISGLLNACGQLKWRNSVILEACGAWILKHTDLCSSREFVSYILTLAALNYIPSDKFILSSIKNNLKFENIGNKDVWLDVIWSLAVLNASDKDSLLNVLSPAFYNSLLDDSNICSISNKLKLLNLKTVLKIQYPECIFTCDLFLEAPELQRSKETEHDKNLVIDALKNFIPKEKFMATNINTDMGIFIDAEFIVDHEFKPLPISTYGLLSKPAVGTKSLPKEATRVALMIWLYKDMTLNEKMLTGVNALAKYLLSHQGYVVVEVPFQDFIKNSTHVQKATYLSRLINETVNAAHKWDKLSQEEKIK